MWGGDRMKRNSLFLLPALFLAFSLMGQEAAPAGEQLNRGNLFSAVLFGNTALGRRWAALRPEAEKLFPALKMKAVSDLHVTFVYIGKGWRNEDLPRLRQAMANAITAAFPLTPGIANIGRNSQVVVVDLQGAPEAFLARVAALKAELNTAGLKRPEAYDSSFRPHVTLGEAKDNPPTEQQARELKAFQEWIAGRLDLPTLGLALEPSMPVQLLLAEATRPEPLPEYITVESFLENSRQ